MADFIFKISPNIVLGSYSSTKLAQYAGEWGSKFMVIMDPILKETGTSDKILKTLSERNIEFFVYDEISVVADTQTVSNAMVLAKEAHVHGIIAVGGNKTLSIAKAVCALYYETHDLYDFVEGASPSTAPLPLICIPTTVRDVFIFTDTTPLSDSRSGKIKLLKTQNGLCKLCLWDANLTATLTDKQISAMALETLCIAIEAYLSPKATFFSDMLIEKSLELMGYALDGAPTLTVTTPQEVLLCQAGAMASLGGATSSLGCAVLLSLSMNARYKVSRSLSTTILLPYIIEDAKQYRKDRLVKISKLVNPKMEVQDEDQAVEKLMEYIRTHIAKANVPARLKDLDLSIEQLALAAEDSGELDMINYLPRSMTTDDLFELIKQAF